MQRSKLDAIREYVSRTTPGPWHVFTDPAGYHLIGFEPGCEAQLRLGRFPDSQAAVDAAFAANARGDLPLLLAEVERLQTLAMDVLSHHQHDEGCHPSAGRHSYGCQLARRRLAVLRHDAEVQHPPRMCPICTPESA